jgi:hypothetical protein
VAVMAGLAMIPYLFFYQLMIVGLLWLCLMLPYVWPGRCAVSPLSPGAGALQTRRARSIDIQVCFWKSRRPV